MPDTVDITPSPRILRTLGHIPFAPWQCVAELVDNSLDGFRQEVAASGQKRVVVSWSTEAAMDDRSIEVVDTGPGMTQAQLNASVRAGHSNNDPMNHLGLFGMGFNIATARLGDKTVVMSATVDAECWSCIEIDFGRLGQGNDFHAPLTFVPKLRPDEHGTKVVISKLNAGIVQQLRSQESQIKRQLEDVYTTILQQTEVSILVQGRPLKPRPHCIWSAQRYVTRRGDGNVPAVVEIETLLDDAVFDLSRNQYLSPAEEAIALQHQLQQGSLPNNLVMRPKRIHGWIGIQRYSDPDDFGIDFVRNGRKVLLRDKSLFSYTNPLTGRSELEYPKELGSTLGGRIVGEIHIDHVPPTYQKNGFQTSDPSWIEMVNVLRGDGPILPKQRTAMGFTGDNTSPVARLINAYRRSDAGVKCLAAPNEKARVWAERFREGDTDYLNDGRWLEAARESDRNPRVRGGRRGARGEVDTGSTASDDPSSYFGGGTNGQSIDGALVQPSAPTPVTPQIDPIDELKSRSIRSEIESGEYAYDGGPSPFEVIVHEVVNGLIGEGEEGDPCLMSKDGMVCNFFYNPRHSFLRGYPSTWRDLLLINLAERFKARDRLDNQDLSLLFANLMRVNFADVKLDINSVQERGHAFFETLRDAATNVLRIREREAIACIYESSGEVEEIVHALLQNVSLLGKFQSRAVGAIEALAVVHPRTLVRLVDRFPDEFFDGKFFSTPYLQISLPDPNATERLRQRSKERVIMFLKDALWIITDTTSQATQNVSKEDIARCAHSIWSLNAGVSA